jgi:hypothetical protein
MTNAIRILLLVFFAATASACSEYSVSEFGPLKLGSLAPERPGSPTAHPYKTVPKAKFYVFIVSHKIPTMCTFEECGINGDIVRRMGGWISGDEQAESAEAVGLQESAVRRGEQSMIVISGENAKIIGIYPNRTMNDLPSILKRHPEIGKIPTDILRQVVR